MITNQEFFDKTVRHLHQQGGPSRLAGHPNENTFCLYRGDKGRSCAIGCHIPDRVYKPEMEAHPFGELIDEFPVVGAYIPDYSLGKRLQICHDKAAYSEDNKPLWVKVWHDGISVFDHAGIAFRLAEVATALNLDPAVVYECWPKESV